MRGRLPWVVSSLLVVMVATVLSQEPTPTPPLSTWTPGPSQEKSPVSSPAPTTGTALPYPAPSPMLVPEASPTAEPVVGGKVSPLWSVATGLVVLVTVLVVLSVRRSRRQR